MISNGDPKTLKQTFEKGRDVIVKTSMILPFVATGLSFSANAGDDSKEDLPLGPDGYTDLGDMPRVSRYFTHVFYLLFEFVPKEFYSF